MYAFNNYQRHPRGFTLIELIVAIAILGFTIFGAAQLFTKSLSVQRRAQHETKAAYLAQEQIETLRGSDYELVYAGTFETRHLVLDPFERQTDVSFVDRSTLELSLDDQGLKRIDVVVFYPTIQGEKSFTLSTFIAKK